MTREKGILGFGNVAGNVNNASKNKNINKDNSNTNTNIESNLASKDDSIDKIDSETSGDNNIINSVKSLLEKDKKKPIIVSRQYYLSSDVVSGLDKLDKGSRNKSKIVDNILREALKQLGVIK